MNFPEVGKQKGEGSLEGGVFLKLKDGEKVKGIFVGDPQIFRLHWPKGENSSPCAGKETCAKCKAGDKPKFRFRINFLTKADDAWVAKVWEQSYGIYLDLKEMHENAYPLPTTLVTVSRTGENQETRYRIMPVKDNGGMTPKHFETLAKIPLNKLSGESSTASEPSDSNEDIPF